MQVSEKKQISLSMEKSQSFTPKNLDRKLSIDLKIIEDFEETISNNSEKNTISPSFEEISGEVEKDIKNIFGQRNFPDLVKERKNSTCSTSISKVDEFCEFNFSLPLKRNLETEKQSNQNCFFGREINRNAVSNYFRETELYYKNLYPEGNDYIKSKNYLKKEKFELCYDMSKNCTNKANEGKLDLQLNNKELMLNKDFSESFEKMNSNNSNMNLNVSLGDSSSLCCTPTGTAFPINTLGNAPTILGAVAPKLNSWGKGKFDLPMYYFGFCNVDSK